LENGVSRASSKCEKAWLGECFAAGWEFERGSFGEWVTIGWAWGSARSRADDDGDSLSGA